MSGEMTPTPHIQAQYGEIAPVVLMPGDPLRAEFIAEKFLENPVCYNKVRGMLGYTGSYKGAKISIQGSGMGMPSMGIYSHELFNFYGVEGIIRIGSAGGLAEGVELNHLIVAESALTDSNYGRAFGYGEGEAFTCSPELLKAADTVKSIGTATHVGRVFTSDHFYNQPQGVLEGLVEQHGVLGVEMETAALYINAAASKKQALSILTVSDCHFKGTGLEALERQRGFSHMALAALETAVVWLTKG